MAVVLVRLRCTINVRRSLDQVLAACVCGMHCSLSTTELVVHHLSIGCSIIIQWLLRLIFSPYKKYNQLYKMADEMDGVRSGITRVLNFYFSRVSRVSLSLCLSRLPPSCRAAHIDGRLDSSFSLAHMKKESLHRQFGDDDDGFGGFGDDGFGDEAAEFGGGGADGDADDVSDAM